MPTLHIVSHTHWDREWYQTFQTFRLRLVHLVDNLLATLDHDPQYLHYMLDGQTIVLEDYLQMRMNNMPKLQQYIQQNRIMIGPWYILPDENLVSPESTIRNLLVGKSICELFGQRMMIGYIPDPFGHISQMPQILCGFHIDTACLWRGVTVDTPTMVWWESPDGSRVMLGHLYTSYGNGAHFPSEEIEVSVQQMTDVMGALESHNPLSQFLVMRGSDHMEPRPTTPTHIAGVNDALGKEVELIHSTLPAYFAAATAEIQARKLELQTIRGELRDSQKAPMLPGVLSARMWIKQRNHACENLLERWVEPFSTWAELILRGIKAFDDTPEYQPTPRIANPAPLIHQAWKMLLTCQPHDSICGCSIDEVHDEMLPRFNQVEQISEQLLSQSLDALSSSIDTQTYAPENAFAAINVFNAASYKQTGLVKVSIDHPVGTGTFDICDEDGNALPFAADQPQRILIDENSYAITELQALLGQVSQDGYNNRKLVRAFVSEKQGQLSIDSEFSSVLEPDMENLADTFSVLMNAFTTKPADERVKVRIFNVPSSTIEVLAPNVPAMGVKTFYVRNIPSSPVTKNAEPNQALIIENEYLTVHLNDDLSGISLTDKRNQATYDGINTFIDRGDRGDEYNFTPPENDQAFLPKVITASVQHDTTSSNLSILYALELPESLTEERDTRSAKKVPCRLKSTLTLVKGVPRLDIRTEFDNQASDHRLEVTIPTGIIAKHARMDGHFDVLQRSLTLPETDSNWIELPRPEVPQRAFCDVSAETRGVMLANRGLPEVSVIAGKDGKAVISLTLLRCVGWLSREDLWNRKGHAGPGLPTPGAQEIGLHTFEYSLIPHDGNWKTAVKQAFSFVTPLKGASTPLHTGCISATSALVTCDTPEFIISAIKATEAGDGWILRGYNMSDDPIQVTITTSIAFSTASEVFLDESHKRSITLETDGTLKLAVGDREIITIKFANE